MASGSSSKRARFNKKTFELDSVRNEINVTPLVDVVLVLLIIMMVIGPMLARGKEVPLPETNHHREPGDNHEPIVAIDQYGKLWVDKDEVQSITEVTVRVQREWEDLRANNAKLGETVDRSGENRVLLKVAPEINYGTVKPLIMALHEIGAEGVDLGTEEQKAQKE